MELTLARTFCSSHSIRKLKTAVEELLVQSSCHERKNTCPALATTKTYLCRQRENGCKLQIKNIFFFWLHPSVENATVTMHYCFSSHTAQNESTTSVPECITVPYIRVRHSSMHQNSYKFIAKAINHSFGLLFRQLMAWATSYCGFSSEVKCKWIVVIGWMRSKPTNDQRRTNNRKYFDGKSSLPKKSEKEYIARASFVEPFYCSNNMYSRNNFVNKSQLNVGNSRCFHENFCAFKWTN